MEELKRELQELDVKKAFDFFSSEKSKHMPFPEVLIEFCSTFGTKQVSQVSVEAIEKVIFETTTERVYVSANEGDVIRKFKDDVCRKIAIAIHKLITGG